MQNPKILLIQLYGDKQPPDAEPLSIEVLASAVLAKYPGAQVRLLTLDLPQAGDFKAEFSGVSPDIIGVSIPQSTYELSIRLLDFFQRTYPEIPIILGHALPTHSPELFLEKYPNITIVRGWGEESFLQLVEYHCLQSRTLEEIPNLCYSRNGKLVFTKIKWPEKIIQPVRHKPEQFFPRVEASRGCHHDVCTFCTRPPNARASRLTWVRRDIAAILSELAEIVSQGRRVFTFTDEDFIGNDIEGAIRLAQGLRDIPGIHFSLSVRVDNVIDFQDSAIQKLERRNCFQILRQAGLYQVFLGVESLSNSQLNRYGKQVDSENCIQAICELRELEINFEAGFILFDPLLTETELIENIQKMEETGLWAHIGQIFNRLRPQRDSAYTALLAKMGMVVEYDPDTLSYETPFLYETIRRVYQEGYAWLQQFDPIYLLARNIERNNFTEKNADGFVTAFRWLTFQYLKQLACGIGLEDHQNPEIFQAINQERDNLIRRLYFSLSAKGSDLKLNETERTLKERCGLFLNLNL